MASLSQILWSIFGPGPSGIGQPIGQARACQIMRRYNPNGLIGVEGGSVCMLEDVSDPDQRMYRIEYQSTPDGRHANAWVRHNPWGPVSDVHTINGGMICVGAGAHDTNPACSPYDLETVIKKARFWCTAISVYHETGEFPNP